MRDPHRGRGLVDMLAARTAGPVSIDLQIIVIDLDVDVFLNIRDHITGGKGRLPFACRIERRRYVRGRCTPFSERR